MSYRAAGAGGNAAGDERSLPHRRDASTPFVSGAGRARGGRLVLSLLASLLYAVLGTGYVLDDWFTLRYARFDGAWAAAGPDQHTARPGAAVVYAVVFGIGQHPLIVLTIQAVIGAATAALLVVVFRSYFPPAVALGAALLWVVLPEPHVARGLGLGHEHRAVRAARGGRHRAAALAAAGRPGRWPSCCSPRRRSATRP